MSDAKNSNHANRRVHERYPIRTSATLYFTEGQNVPARSLDIGEGGACVVCDYNVPVGTQLKLQMSLPSRVRGATPFVAGAIVKNCTLSRTDGGFRLGLQFGALSAEAKAALQGVLG